MLNEWKMCAASISTGELCCEMCTVFPPFLKVICLFKVLDLEGHKLASFIFL